jgi:DNA invertase Pin-like site-specific DNA recombinase
VPTRETETPKPRAVAYIRESTEEQGQGFSPDAQREQIRRFAAENGLDLGEEYSDFHSGWRKADARPQFQRLMSDAAEQRFDVVLVYHTSRFARNQAESRRYKQLLRERLGIRVVSVTQPMGEDPTDPAAFLAESIQDEYYSVSLSFWTRTGLREKARQGHLLGQLPWGYVRDLDSGLAAPDPERAPLVRELFELYSTGQESDRTMAAWLNAKGALTSRGRPFGKDTVRDMLLNAAYCGHVTGMRSKDRSIKGLHEPLVSEELFDRVQQMRTWRARVVKPGRPSEEYLLRKLLYCERCDARMHGQKGSTPQVRRYMCSTRRYGGECEQPITKAEPLEVQIVEWLRGFQPDEELRAVVLASLRQAAKREGGDGARRKELGGQLERLRELRDGRPDQGRIRDSLSGDRRGAGADRPAARSPDRARRRDPARLRPLLGGRAEGRRAAQADRLALRPRLAGRGPDRRGQAARAVPALLPARRRGRPATHGCQSREQGWGWSNPQRAHQTAWPCGRCQ